MCVWGGGRGDGGYACDFVNVCVRECLYTRARVWVYVCVLMCVRACVSALPFWSYVRHSFTLLGYKQDPKSKYSTISAAVTDHQCQWGRRNWLTGVHLID